MTVKHESKEKELVFSWSNVDGEVRVFNSWSELLEEECWDCFSNDTDSLDIYEAGILIKATPLAEEQGRIFFKDQYGKYWEYSEDVGEFLYAKVYVHCVPSRAREEVAKKIKEFRE